MEGYSSMNKSLIADNLGVPNYFTADISPTISSSDAINFP